LNDAYGRELRRDGSPELLGQCKLICFAEQVEQMENEAWLVSGVVKRLEGFIFIFIFILALLFGVGFE